MLPIAANGLEPASSVFSASHLLGLWMAVREWKLLAMLQHFATFVCLALLVLVPDAKGAVACFLFQRQDQPATGLGAEQPAGHIPAAAVGAANDSAAPGGAAYDGAAPGGADFGGAPQGASRSVGVSSSTGRSGTGGLPTSAAPTDDPWVTEQEELGQLIESALSEAVLRSATEVELADIATTFSQPIASLDQPIDPTPRWKPPLGVVDFPLDTVGNTEFAYNVLEEHAPEFVPPKFISQMSTLNPSASDLSSSNVISDPAFGLTADNVIANPEPTSLVLWALLGCTAFATRRFRW